MSATTAEAGFSLDRAANTIRFKRRLAAAPDVVFAMWTQAEHVSRWWDPTGEPLTECQIDLRPGGAFSFATEAHTDRPFAGVYREVSPPSRLVFDAMGSVGRVLLSEAPEGTLLTVEIECASPEHLEQFVQMGVAVGTAQTLDNLVTYAGEA